MKELLSHLLEHGTLSKSESIDLMRGITEARFSPIQVGALLTALRTRPITPEELGGFREVLLECASPLDLSHFNPVDLCGTGGDNKNTFNISTIASFVVAGAGIPVAKHGNYGVSSICGSSNLLEALKIPFPASQESAVLMLERAGICFLHAPLWHPAMKKVAPIRKELGVRTVFNILGPLINPCRPRRQLVGVFSKELFDLYTKVLGTSEIEFRVVHTLGGYDEISLTGPALIASPRGVETVKPDAFSAHLLKDEDLKGGSSVSDSVEICLRLLKNQGTPAQKEVVLANAALALSTADTNSSLFDCVARARESLESGKAFEVLTTLQKI